VFGILARSVFKKRRFNSDGIKDSHKQAAPGVPISVTATASIKSARVSWTAPSDGGGSQITGYSVTPVIGGGGRDADPRRANIAVHHPALPRSIR